MLICELVCLSTKKWPNFIDFQQHVKIDNDERQSLCRSIRRASFYCSIRCAAMHQMIQFDSLCCQCSCTTHVLLCDLCGTCKERVATTQRVYDFVESHRHANSKKT